VQRTGLVALGEIFVNRRARDAGAGFSDATGEPERHVGRQLTRGQQEGAFRAFSVRVMARAIRAALDDVAGQYGADPGIDLGLWAKELVTMFDLALARGSSEIRGRASFLDDMSQITLTPRRSDERDKANFF